MCYNNDCPICMETILGDSNRVVTECGHCFHTNCLMTHVAMRGFGCPYCRNQMMTYMEEPEEEQMDESYVPEQTQDISSIIAYEEDVVPNILTLDDLNLEEEEEDAPRENSPPSPNVMAQKLLERGVTFESLVQLLMGELPEYSHMNDRLNLPIEKFVYDKMNDVLREYEQI